MVLKGLDNLKKKKWHVDGWFPDCKHYTTLHVVTCLHSGSHGTPNKGRYFEIPHPAQ